MKIITDIFSEISAKPLALSIGMYDGVHLGHQKIIGDLQKISEEKNLETGIFTFWPHPRLFFNPKENLKMLTTLGEKELLLENFGIQNLFLQKFDEDFKNYEAEDFVKEILVNKLNVKYLIIGHDHTFGKNKRGNFEFLQKLSGDFGFEVEQTRAVEMNGEPVSSTKIRNYLSEGRISAANQMLGYDFSVSGKVIHGKKIGRTIGFPTANLEIDKHKLLPKEGAYIVSVSIDNQNFMGMMSIGTNPTFGENPVTAEVYILGFSEDIYGREITVKFHDFLHDQIPFENIEKLIIQLNHDKNSTERYFESL